MRLARWLSIGAAAWLLVACSLARATKAEPAADAAGVAFYEKQVRPILQENCFKCHGPDRQRAGLRLDSLLAMLKGGDRGPAIVPGYPDKSRLVLAIQHADERIKMPPSGKLKPAEIETLTAWIKMGAPAPKEAGPVVSSAFNLTERAKFWAYQPVKPVAPPTVKDAAWSASPIDRFIRAKQEAAGVTPAGLADKHTLLRRVTFDLTGLPPTPAEIAAFLADESPDAFEKVVDRLLASPHYGERWGRHWLDLVRYAETLGHEFDFELPNAYRYRDYVIRAFNADVPYDQFVREHIAGDLLPQPRRHSTEGFNESILGTGFYWLGEVKHAPVDIIQEEADRIDNQIDVLSKTFLAQTVSCARCHDHKFDAISAKDYYALFGYVKSTRYHQAILDAPERIEQPAAVLRKLREQVAASLFREHLRQLAGAAAYLEAGLHLIIDPKAVIKTVAAQRKLDAALLAKWRRALADGNLPSAFRIYQELRREESAEALGQEVARRREQQQREAKQAEESRRGCVLLPVKLDGTRESWLATGHAFEPRPAAFGDVQVSSKPDRAVEQYLTPGRWHSAGLSPRLEGEMRSPSFVVEKRYIYVRAAGRGGRISVVPHGLNILRNPLHAGLTMIVNDDKLAWRSFDMSRWQGLRVYIELMDSSTPSLSEGGGRFDPAKPDFLEVAEVVLSDGPRPPTDPPSPFQTALLASVRLDSAEAALGRITALLKEDPPAAPTDIVEALNWLLRNELLADGGDESLRRALADYRSIEARLPTPTRGLAVTDGPGEDQPLYLRGDYRNAGPAVPRRFLEALGGDRPAGDAAASGSGRLELANRIADPRNPLTARVLVNRLWQHHFGEGLVRTPDDFGKMGQLPTHAELLDYLAADFIRGGWSIKRMHKRMLLSRTYQLSHEASAKTLEGDPENRLLTRRLPQRLEGEAIRDAILSISGRLNRTMHGPGPLPHLTPHMEGRGRPGVSGPLDGDGRRSVYLNVRRNFLSPLFLAFDYPTPFSTMGKRTVSNVPAQALVLMNNPFVLAEAKRWAERVVKDGPKEPEQRIRVMYETAFARPPTANELEDSLAFVKSEAQRLKVSQDDPRPWADLAHVLFNVKEFVFVR